MGYAWQSVCYQDTASALAAFSRSIPDADAAGINTFAATPTISGSGLITWLISNRPFSSTSATTRTGTTQLPICADTGMDQWPVQSAVFYLALFFAFAIGFRTGFRP